MDTQRTKSPTIVIAGASGYVGRALIPKLLKEFPNSEIVALSRSVQDSLDSGVSWRPCDLFSLKSLEEALPAKVDLAFYLVHSMGPTAQLDQGCFSDYDLILADNFARALKTTSFKQLVYLGGLIPEVKDLSLHLQSRLEVEETFAQHKLPITVFRAGLILGEGGSSFQILLKLVKRLPVMVCPQWTKTQTTPVDLSTVLDALVQSSLKPEHFNKVYDLAGCEPLTYMEMMKETARKLGLKRYFISVPFFTPTLSRLWVSLITNTPKDLVYPLIESLKHPMVARKEFSFFKDTSKKTYFELLEKASMKTHEGRSLFQFKAQRKTVRSVQRLPVPSGKSAEWVMNQYVHWLPRFFYPFAIVSLNGNRVSFSVLLRKWVMLDLSLHKGRSSEDRQLLYIEGGFLMSDDTRGRLEFREVLNRRFVLAAIHNYTPSLPWFVYKYTQAWIHLFVMNAFRRYLVRKNKS